MMQATSQAVPLLVMNVEHTFITDYGLKRADYMETSSPSTDRKLAEGSRRS